MQPKVEVTVSLPVTKALKQAMRPGSAVMQRILKLWAIRVRAFWTRRFVKFSRGGGDWPPLKSKRKRGKKSAASILIDTGLLLGGLVPVFSGLPGQFEAVQGLSVTVGYGGDAKYPDGRATVADIAYFHTVGAGYLPVRKVIDIPDQQTLSAMSNDASRILQQSVFNRP